MCAGNDVSPQENPFCPFQPAISHFIGRQNELKKFDQLLQRLIRGEPVTSLLISGEPGVGKTSLLLQFFGRCFGVESQRIAITFLDLRHYKGDIKEVYYRLVDGAAEPREFLRKIKKHFGLNEKAPLKDVGREIIQRLLKTTSITFPPSVAIDKLFDTKALPSDPTRLSQQVFKIYEEMVGYPDRYSVIFLDGIGQVANFPNRDLLLETIFDLLNIAVKNGKLMIVAADRPAGIGRIESVYPQLRSNTLWELVLVERLNEREAESLLKKPLDTMKIPYSLNCIRRILELCSGDPYYLQLLGAAYWEALMQNRTFDPDIEAKNIHALIAVSCGGSIATEVLKALANAEGPVSSTEIQGLLKTQEISVDAAILEKEILKQIEESPYKTIASSNGLYWIRHELFAEYLRDLGSASSKAQVDAERRLTLAGRSFKEFHHIIPQNALINLLPKIPKIPMNDVQAITFIASSLENNTPFLFAFKAEERHEMLARALVILASHADVVSDFGLPDWSTVDGHRSFDFMQRVMMPELLEPFVYEKTMSAWGTQFRSGEEFDRAARKAFLLLARMGVAQETYPYINLRNLPIARAISSKIDAKLFRREIEEAFNKDMGNSSLQWLLALWSPNYAVDKLPKDGGLEVLPFLVAASRIDDPKILSSFVDRGGGSKEPPDGRIPYVNTVMLRLARPSNLAALLRTCDLRSWRVLYVIGEVIERIKQSEYLESGKEFQQVARKIADYSLTEAERAAKSEERRTCIRSRIVVDCIKGASYCNAFSISDVITQLFRIGDSFYRFEAVRKLGPLLDLTMSFNLALTAAHDINEYCRYAAISLLKEIRRQTALNNEDDLYIASSQQIRLIIERALGDESKIARRAALQYLIEWPEPTLAKAIFKCRSQFEDLARKALQSLPVDVILETGKTIINTTNKRSKAKLIRFLGSINPTLAKKFGASQNLTSSYDNETSYSEVEFLDEMKYYHMDFFSFGARRILTFTNLDEGLRKIETGDLDTEIDTMLLAALDAKEFESHNSGKNNSSMLQVN